MNVNTLVRYLPHRQFRNDRGGDAKIMAGYLPHRQFRKATAHHHKSAECYLPHRQFRNLPAADGCTEFSYLPSRQFRKLKLCKIWGETNRSTADIVRKWRRVPDYVHDADQNCRRTGSKGVLRCFYQINTIYRLILLGMYIVLTFFVFYDETEPFVRKSAY